MLIFSENVNSGMIKSKNLKLVFAALMTGLFIQCQGQGRTAPLQKSINKTQLVARLDKRVPQLLDSANIPGLSIAVISEGKVIYSGAYGVKNAETKEKVDVNTVFDAASLSKPMFAYAVLQLVDAGLIDLDKPLYQYLPYEDILRDKRYQKITARMVLSHSTGFPNWRGGDSLRIKFEPGKQFSYSGEGFVYLQKVVEKLTGRPLNEVMAEKVFTPLGMNYSSYVWNEKLEKNFAMPHGAFGNVIPKNKPGEVNAAYSLQTTAGDYATFIAAILNETGLKKQTAQAMVSPQIQVPQKSSEPTVLSKFISWGLGFGLQQSSDGNAFWHWGDNNPFKAYIVAYKKEKTGVVYFANSYNGLSIIKEITALTTGGDQLAVDYLDYDRYNEPAMLFMKNIPSKGVSKAIQPYLNSAGKLNIEEGKMNDIGYQLLRSKKVKEAKEVFKLNVEAYPQSANVYDSYGEALLANGEFKLAADNYLKSYELNPKNEGAKQLADRLLTPQSQNGNTTIRLKGYPDAKLVTLAGSFNKWNNLHTFFYRKGDEWIAKLDLPPGQYQYKIVVDGEWILDPGNNATTTENGHTNSALVVK
jgi:CubicO group peptidase (beta-lactamase class C family)